MCTSKREYEAAKKARAAKMPKVRELGYATSIMGLDLLCARCGYTLHRCWEFCPNCGEALK